MMLIKTLLFILALFLYYLYMKNKYKSTRKRIEVELSKFMALAFMNLPHIKHQTDKNKDCWHLFCTGK